MKFEMQLSEIILYCVIVLIFGMIIGAGWNASQTFEECSLYGNTEFHAKVFTCAEYQP